MAALGIPEQQIAEHLDQRQQQVDDRPTFNVWGVNAEAVMLFMRVCNLWRHAGMGQIIGLDYPAIKVDLDYAQITVTPTLWQELKLMEGAALVAMREKG